MLEFTIDYTLVYHLYSIMNEVIAVKKKAKFNYYH